MTRLARTGPVAVLLLAASLAAPRVSAPPPTPAPSPVSTSISVQSYGAVPGRDCTAAFQAALDFASRQSTTASTALGFPAGASGVRVYVPGSSQPYMVRGPLFVRAAGVAIEGDGPASVVASSNGAPLFVFGSHDGQAGGAADRPDAWGVLDAGAAPRPGARRGVRTGANHLVFPAQPMGVGPNLAGVNEPGYYGDVSALTLDLCLDFAPGGFDRGVAFWRGVTGYGLSERRGPAGEFATLVPSAGDDYLRVQALGVGDGRVHLDLHPGGPQLGKTLSSHLRIGVGDGADHLGDAGINQRVAAGACASCVGAGLQRDISRCPTGVIALRRRITQRHDLGMRPTGLLGEALTDDLALGID